MLFTLVAQLIPWTSVLCPPIPASATSGWIKNVHPVDVYNGRRMVSTFLAPIYIQVSSRERKEKVCRRPVRERHQAAGMVQSWHFSFTSFSYTST